MANLWGNFMTGTKTMEERYLEKISNDIEERLYDLLIIHLIGFEDKVKVNRDKLVHLLENAIERLRTGVNYYNKLSYYRYILILCNIILRFQKDNSEVKEVKKEIIEDYTHSEHGEEASIPLNYQINEIRITYDTRYLLYLVKKFINEKLWHKALYCLIPLQLIEPDNPDLDNYYEEIKKHIPRTQLEKKSFGTPCNMVLALDSNVVISKICYDVGEYRIKSKQNFDLDKLGNYNKFIITVSVMDEVRKHLDFRLAGIKNFCKHNPRFNFENIRNTLEKRFDKVICKYGVDNAEPDKHLIDKINSFYLRYLDKLEEILLQKLDGNLVSYKLKKLAQRESMLPEEGDMRLLAEVIALNDEKEHGILSSDQDFTSFAGPIYDEFGIKIFSGEDENV